VKRAPVLGGEEVETRCPRREEDLVTRRQLETAGRQEPPPGPLAVQLRDAVRLTADLRVRLLAGAVLRVRSEEPERDRRGDQPGDHHRQQEERRELEAERPQHRGLGSARRSRPRLAKERPCTRPPRPPPPA